METEQQHDLLTDTDTLTQAQGFHFCEAVGAERATELLRLGRIPTPMDLRPKCMQKKNLKSHASRVRSRMNCSAKHLALVGVAGPHWTQPRSPSPPGSELSGWTGTAQIRQGAYKGLIAAG